MAAGRHFEKRKIAKTRQLFEMSSQILKKNRKYYLFKKLQAIYLMLYKRYKTAKIKKYKHEHYALA